MTKSKISQHMNKQGKSQVAQKKTADNNFGMMQMLELPDETFKEAL